ncbi:MAG: hypothetical protein P8188_20285 [Gemmatimonadota bacterium]|jgi:D-aspartate ligase
MTTSRSPQLERHSRWYRQAPGEAPAPEPDRLAEYLEAHLDEGTVLIPTSDAYALALARMPESVRDRWPVVAARAEAVEIMVDKALFAEVLRVLDVPHPLTRPIANAREMAALDQSRLDGCFLKPTDSQPFFARFGVKAARAATGAEAAEWASRVEDLDIGLLVQEYVPGPADLHYYVEGFFTGDDATSAWFARRRLRIYPPDFGNSTRMVSVPLEEVAPAREDLARLLAHLNFRGIFSAEFKRDPRDGEFKLLEVNARPWWYVEFAVRCGVDVVNWGYRDALGLPLGDPPSYDVGRRCIYPYYDFHAVREMSGLMSAVLNVRSWIGAWQPIFRWEDPAPALHEVGDLVLRRRHRPSGSPGDAA